VNIALYVQFVAEFYYCILDYFASFRSARSSAHNCTLQQLNVLS
jgi:hypothetical protein